MIFSGEELWQECEHIHYSRAEEHLMGLDVVWGGF